MKQNGRDWSVSGWAGVAAGVCLFAAAGCETVPPPKLPPKATTVKVEDAQKVDDLTAERLKLQAKFREGMDLYDAGRTDEGLAVLRGVLKDCADKGIALPPTMDARLRATLEKRAAPPATPKPPVEVARPAPPPPKEEPAATQLPLRLLSTLVGDQNPGAVIEDRRTKAQKLYSVGDMVLGAKIVEIARDRVVLLVNGRRETLAASPVVAQTPSAPIAPNPPATNETQPPKPVASNEVRLPKLTDPAKADKKISIDMHTGVDIRLFINTVSDYTGLNFYVDDAVKGTVTLFGPTEIRLGEIYKVLESILEMKNYAAVPAGNIIKIIPRADAPKRPIGTSVGSDPNDVPSDDSLYVQIIPLSYASAADISNLITPLQSGSVSTYQPTNSVILIDTRRNIRRVLEIIKNFDVPGEREEIAVIGLKHAQAGDLSAQILQVLEKQAPAMTTSVPTRPGPAAPPPPISIVGAATKAGVTIIPDARTNSLVVVANARMMANVRELVQRLDTERPPLDIGNIHVVYLENAEAEDVAKSLADALQSAAAQKPGTASSGKSEAVRVTADKNTNALIIVASPEDYQMVASIIKQLDILREQVLVEVRIVEVSEDLLRDIGFEWSTFDAAASNQVRGFAGTNFGLAEEATAGTLSGGAFGLFKQINGVPKIGALMALIENKTGVNILSTPQILTVNHKKATITVGEHIPYIKQSDVLTTTVATPQTVNTFDYMDVGVMLTLTPHISHNGLVRLEMRSSFTQVIPGATGVSANTPTTSKREAETEVSIQNGATIVVGGLISDSKTDAVSRVPLLGSIPLIGFLFQHTTTTVQKTNLLLFITPHVLTSREDVAASAGSRAPADPSPAAKE